MDLKEIYRENFKVLCVTVSKKRPELAKMIKSISEDAIIRVNKEYTIHLLRKTRTPSGMLYHIRLINNDTDRCVLQGPVMIPVQRKTKE